MKSFVSIIISIASLAAAPAQMERGGPLPRVAVNWPEARQGAVQTAGFYPRPVAMKLLLLSGDGKELSLKALQLGLNYLGIPYDSVIGSTQPMPPLTENGKGLYQGILLATGSLAYQSDGVWKSALSSESWAQLDAYCRDYQVRTVSYYTFPEARYGMRLVKASNEQTSIEFPAAAAALFPYLNRNNPLSLAGSYLYLAEAVAAANEETVPVLTAGGAVTGVLHTKADGRQTLAYTMDHNPALRHSTALFYGAVNWVTKGIFLGERRTYLTPQNDDLFLANRLFVSAIEACRPTAFVIDQSAPELQQCPALRITGADLAALRDWQKNVKAVEQTAAFRVTQAFNGYGANIAGDALVAEALDGRDEFFWVSHTYDHKNLDCFARDAAGQCRGVNAAESLFEISENWNSADRLQLPIDRSSLVTPGLSGLGSSTFLAATAAQGIRYLVSDASRPEWLPGDPNTALRVGGGSPLLIIPRRATSLFFYTATADANAPGSEPDAYNFLYGPEGVFHIGGTADGLPFFGQVQTYESIVNRESDVLLGHMLRGDIYPLMFHQSNFWRYDGVHSLFTDLMDMTLDKFKRISTLPIISLQQSEIGRRVEERMTFLASSVKATLEPEGTILLESPTSAVIPITGICPAECEYYGGQPTARVVVEAGRALRVRWQQ